ncbi:MAG: GatB/YqeY domain-containing protein [Chloroflexota bacterium]|nr:GatB/YqeY domain-containing protein [Chloroflexota bacterium]
MSVLKAELQSALKEAMKAKDSQRRNAIRLLNSAIKQVEIDTRTPLDDEGVQAVLQKEAKQHRETIAELEAAGRAEEIASARFDLETIESFLPSRLTEDELRQIVRRAIDETGASSLREMGAIMRAVMPQVRGRADGKQVNSLVKEILS